MAGLPEDIVRYLPYLRRHARLLTGAQEIGDEYVRICLEMILAEPHHIAGGDLRVRLFRAFHTAWQAVATTLSTSSPLEATGYEERLEQGLTAIPALERRVLLLVVVEGFTYEEVGQILDLEPGEVRQLVAKARRELHSQVSVPVLIIEDEPLIAMELSRIMQEMGHTIVGIANREQTAVKEAEEVRPGLVLADIQLLDEGSGIGAAQRILQRFDVPVVFVTGYPERLLTGGRLEPAFVVTKPFQDETLKVTVANALAIYASPEKRAQHKEGMLAKLGEITGNRLARPV